MPDSALSCLGRPSVALMGLREPGVLVGRFGLVSARSDWDAGETLFGSSLSRRQVKGLNS